MIKSPTEVRCELRSVLARCSVLGANFSHNFRPDKTSEPGADVWKVVVEVHHGEERVGAGPAAVDVVGQTHQTQRGLPPHFLSRVEVDWSTGEE